MTKPDQPNSPMNPTGSSDPIPPDAREAFEAMFGDFLDGELDAPQVESLERLLSEHPPLQSEACERLTQHRLLGLIHQQPATHDPMVEEIVTAASMTDEATVDTIMTRITPSRPAGRLRGWAVAATVAAVLLGIAALIAGRPGGEVVAERRSAPSIATLIVCEACEWTETPRDEGSRLTAGPLSLRKGFAVVRFDGGAEAVLSGDCAMELLSSGSARLSRGGVVVRAPEEASGFVLLTPESELLDLGTEFSARVSKDGGTTLDVLEGEVAVRPIQADAFDEKVLQAGQAVTVKTPKSAPREVPVTSPRFAALVDGAKLKSRWELTHAYEGFFYDDGDVPLKRSRRGKGWNGPWRTPRSAEERHHTGDWSLTPDRLTIVSSRMNVTWPVPGGRQGMLEFPPGVTTLIRQMRKPIPLAEDRVTFLSMMVLEPEHPPLRRRREGDPPREAIRVTLRSSEDYLGESVSFGLSTSQRPRIMTGTGVGVRGTSRAPSGQTTLWLGKITTRADGPDEARFRIFRESDELGFAEPSEWDVVAADLDLSSTLDLVVLTSAGQSPRVIDELRIGPTFRSVAPVPDLTVARQLDALSDASAEASGIEQ